MVWKDQPLGLIIQSAGSNKQPKVKASVFSRTQLAKDFLNQLKQELIWRFNFNLDLSKFYQAVSKDKKLRPVVKKFRGLRPMHTGSLYEYLIIAIVLQNATVRSSVSMMQTLFENYGQLVKFDNRLFWCFWQPKKLAHASEQKLRRLKMGYRAKSLIKVSQPFADNEIDELELRNESQEEQKETLISLYGIGPASVGYIMFDVFHHWDYLRHISPWEQKIYTKLFFNKDYEKELVPVEKMLKYFNKWGKWKMLAIHYVWEDIWWRRRNKHIPWLEKLVRL
ncbi:MAG: hypothetical protein Q8P32_00390 [Candidatus Komeilibacteria bacterium]|nr:hypothetical protein [Candidatus Komeilibacteria bacterium]